MRCHGNVYIFFTVRRINIIMVINMLWKVIAVIAAYLIGSINNAIIICKFKNVDIKSVGSGNAGATNTVRALGKKYGIAVFFLDFLKGVISVLVGNFFQVGFYCAIASVIGHVFPIYFGFKGGKGVSTAFGALALCDVRIALILGAVVLILILTVKIVSLSVLICYFLLPFLVLTLNGFVVNEFFYISILLSLIIYFTHRENIKRLLSGTENKFGNKKNQEE